MIRPSAPTRITATGGPWPLHGATASRQVEQAALAGCEPHLLMERAGLALARLALALAPHARTVQVLSGPGNNGGDGLVAARHLHRAGLAVAVSLVADAARLPADAAQALQQAAEAGVEVRPWSGTLPAADLCIDALLGLGATRAPAGPIAAAIAALNRGCAPVLAVDIPSGLHPDSGALLGAEAVRATATLALLTLKPGCYTAQGRDHAGEVWLDRLDTTAGSATAWLTGQPALQPRLHAAHKGSFGDVAVVGGAPGMVGAAWLAARAALAAGAGRVYCSLLGGQSLALDPARPELMARADYWRSPPTLLAQTTVVCGCGGGDAVREALPPLLAHAARLVLDADALNATAADPALQTLMKARAARGRPTLLTPHPLEAARLLQIRAAEVQADRLAAAQSLAVLYGVAVLLKGSGSISAASGATPFINPTGNGALATAGTGDVLAGWAAGRWSRQPGALPQEVAAAAAWLHGRAADQFRGAEQGAPLRAADLVEAMASYAGA
jgi:hydroxyethylthiazole kinase-like uncharacterized protein yjeF